MELINFTKLDTVNKLSALNRLLKKEEPIEGVDEVLKDLEDLKNKMGL